MPSPFYRGLAVVIPVIVATLLCVIWTRGQRLMLGGDEPHYVIMARSIALDRDVALWNNYQEDALTGEIYGPVTPHAYQNTPGWLPYHSVGLSMLIAWPFRYGGLDGVRLTLIALSALIPLSIALWLPRRVPAVVWVLLSCSIALSVPFSYGASHIYPDLVASAFLLAAVLACVHVAEGGALPSGVWAAIWLAVGFLPWLQSRFLAAAALLVAAGAVLALRAPSARRLGLIAGLMLAVVGVGALLVFNASHYGSLSGPPRWNELTRSPARAAMIFLGLHLDQSQGLFVQQPMWLLGVVGIVPFARSKPILAAWLALLYLSVIVPGALQMGRYGGAGPVGRYGWAAAFLWVVPFGYLFAVCGGAMRRWLTRCVIGLTAIQAVIAMRWMTSPEVLAPTLDAGFNARETLGPIALRHLLPSFYFWDFASYWTYVPNIVAIAGVCVLIGLGGVVHRYAEADPACV